MRHEHLSKNARSNGWTDAEDRTIFEGIEAKRSARQIADRLPTKTRNAVLGRMMRLRSAGRLPPVTRVTDQGGQT